MSTLWSEVLYNEREAKTHSICLVELCSRHENNAATEEVSSPVYSYLAWLSTVLLLSRHAPTGSLFRRKWRHSHNEKAKSKRQEDPKAATRIGGRSSRWIAHNNHRIAHASRRMERQAECFSGARRFPPAGRPPTIPKEKESLFGTLEISHVLSQGAYRRVSSRSTCLLPILELSLSPNRRNKRCCNALKTALKILKA